MLIINDSIATLVAGAVQAFATAGAIAGTVWQTNKTLKRADDTRKEEADAEARRRHRQAAELIRMLANRLKVASEIMGRDRLSNKRVASLAARAFDSHLAALERFRFEELSPKAMERFEGAIGITQSVRLEVEEFQDIVSSFEDVRNQRELCAMRVGDYAEQVFSIYEKMISSSGA